MTIDLTDAGHGRLAALIHTIIAAVTGHRITPIEARSAVAHVPFLEEEIGCCDYATKRIGHSACLE
jgi:hypothetical protein